MDNNDMLVEEKDENGKFNIKKTDGYSAGGSSYSSALSRLQ